MAKKHIYTDHFKAMGFKVVDLLKDIKVYKGKKLMGGVYPTGWNKDYKYNDNASRAGVVITGEGSGVVVIDCDNNKTYKEFCALDEEYKFKARSVTSDDRGGHIYYKYTDKLGAFSHSLGGYRLDFLTGGKACLLPTVGNESKVFMGGLATKLKDMPKEVLDKLLGFNDSNINKDLPAVVTPPTVTSNRLYPLVSEFIELSNSSKRLNKKTFKKLFKIITPKSFRDCGNYIKDGYLHPLDVEQGRGSEYLSKVSAILGSDISIDVDTYNVALSLINSMFDEPMDDVRLMQTILSPMITGAVAVDGEPLWRYDSKWSEFNFTFLDKEGNLANAFFDKVTNIYVVVDEVAKTTSTFIEGSRAYNYVSATIRQPVKKQDFIAKIPLVNTAYDFLTDWGFGEDNVFNLYKRSKNLTIIQEGRKDPYKEPTRILTFLKSLIPDDLLRGYFLSFVRTKLTTMEFSPVVFYFIGVAGSGKDVLCNLLRLVVGEDYVASPPPKVFLEKNNQWILKSLFTQLNEYGDALRGKERDQALGLIKGYTGNQSLMVREMGKDGYESKHNTTIIMTTNSSALDIAEGDRRLCIIPTPNKLIKNEAITRYGDLGKFFSDFNGEVEDFCYHLHKKVKNLSSVNYHNPPMTQDKNKLIAENLSALDKVVFWVRLGMYEDLMREVITVSTDFDLNDICKSWSKGKVYEKHLFILYSVLTEGYGKMTSLKFALDRFYKTEGIKRLRTTHNGESNSMYFTVDELPVIYNKKVLPLVDDLLE